MDQIILNRNAEKWIEACQFLKSAEIKPQLDASEWTAVEGLSELWSKPYERGRVKENAEDLISILKECENLHTNNLDIKTYSKQLSGVARDMFLTDKQTFESFQDIMYKKTGKKRPDTKKKETPIPQKDSGHKPTIDLIMINRHVQNFINAYAFLNSNEIKAALSDEEQQAIDCIGRILMATQRSSSDIRTLENAIEILKRYENFHPNNLNIKTQSKQLSGVAREVGLGHIEIFIAFAKAFNSKKAELNKKLESNKPHLSITEVEFGQTSDKNEVLNAFGTQIEAGLYYLDTRLTIDTNIYQTKIDFHFIIQNRTGKVIKEYDLDTIVNGSGTYTLPGYGNTSGNFLPEPGNYTVIISFNRQILTKAPLKLIPSKRASAPIKIVKIDFANQDSKGNIINDYDEPLPINTQYLGTRLTLETEFRGEQEVNVSIISSKGTVHSFSDTIYIDGSGQYTISGYGNEKGTAYNEGGFWRIEFSGKNIIKKSTRIRIGKKSRNWKKWLLIAFGIYMAFKLIPMIPLMFAMFDSSESRYTIAESSKFRSAPFINKNNEIGTFDYGQEVTFKKQKNEMWASISNSKQDGYISSILLMTKKEFMLFNSIFGGQEMNDTMAVARQMIPEIGLRRALIQFYISQKYLGRMSQETAKEAGFDFEPNNQNQWMILRTTGNSKRENVLHSANDIVGIIVQSPITGERKTLVFGKSDSGQYECLYTENAPKDGGLASIHKISSSSFEISYGGKTATKSTSKRSSSKKKTKEKNKNINKEKQPESKPAKQDVKEEKIDPSKGGFKFEVLH